MKTLTRDALACLSQTVNGLVELSEYLLRKELFEYVIVGSLPLIHWKKNLANFGKDLVAHISQLFNKFWRNSTFLKQSCF